MRTTLVDIAREAGVSTATVDRVLNKREGVKARTRDRVLAVASRLGYIDGAPPAAAAGPGRRVELDFVMPGGTNSFIRLLGDHFLAWARQRADIGVRLHLLEGFDPDLLTAKLDELRGRTHGVGVVALDHPAVREAIRGLVLGGIPVVTLASDISNVPRLAYVGIDNRAAGRLAGHLLGRFMGPGGGKVALFAGSLAYRGHEEREMGFRHMLAESAPHLSVLELREIRDDTDRAYREASALLERHDDVTGIYNIGAGNRGIARALEERGRGQTVVFIGHELTAHTRRFLLSGTMDAVIDQNPRVEARDAIERLVRAVRGEPEPALPPVRIQALFRENIPEV
ncbi:LacI family DNA-binding transcriptional regulator [Labrys monachus]|uniref:LacI family transcriptional regulator n=1 Tax=Labrys monachus TaxID=217067 RepID=A0ABU0F857_9HYPH|nr:LacI family DNA-binding transcriptional regulator [Labrys monachus]MDQ0390557.1 LacI family transcriptional regulator [Labrys monachus]